VTVEPSLEEAEASNHGSPLERAADRWDALAHRLPERRLGDYTSSDSIESYPIDIKS